MDLGHTAVLLLELGAVLFGLGLLGSLAGRIGLSPIPLYLLAGLAFGTGGLLPLDAPEGFFSTGAEVGIVLLLLVLGLEYTAGDLVENLRRQAPVGVVDLLLNGLPGAALALFLGWGPTAALAMFGVTAISSSGIVSKLLTDLGRLGNRETPAVLGVLVIEDLAMAAYLPVLTGVVAATTTGDALLSVSVALATLAAVLAVAVRHGNTVTRFVGARSNEILLLRVLGLALLVAGAAEAVHVSAAVGAFLLGIALSGEVAERIGDVLAPLRDLFAAVFFVFFGLSTDPSQLPGALLPAAALAAVGIVTKFGTGWVAGRRAGVGPPGRVRAGAALVARGEFSIIIAGLVLGSVPAAFGSTVAAYVLILAVLGPLAPRLVDPWVRRLAQRSAPPRSALPRPLP
ncbi:MULTISPECIES: cation:proton antiporter [unclassified Modestobacter]|uniref:cation:proton antiporter n=1 Tax=unclassified Modestobacter TaxID=2643866 RepID=UPI0022AA2365|nr:MULTISPECIES: cation:proton antiporter [unclassified Modestobacter]MCZ2825507.1 cation:proton antiporter [Modestobacter sp. VKM Ac-2981]MCZ2853428.1 cation:proton antiporter [Modestobacter sp. VKM Ac-2982]